MKIRSEITAYMKNNYHDHIDECGEVNFTSLAEDTAYALNHPEWLEEDTHIIWDIAIDISNKFN